MASTTYKLSNYNFVVENNGELIVYNSYIGMNSILKISSEELKKIVKPDCERMAIDDNKYVEILIEKGLLVEKNIDELTLVNKKKEEYFSNNMLEITISLTKKCNFNCTYCYEKKDNCTMNIKTIDNLVKLIKILMRNKKTLKVNWFGGEPLIEKNLLEALSRELIKYCRENKKLYFSTMTTNGYLLDTNTLKLLMKLKVYSFQITIDGTKKTHNTLRPLSNGGETYDKILINLKEISKKIKSPMLRILYRCNFTSDSWNDYKSVIEEYCKNFLDDNRFDFLPMIVNDWGGEKVKSIKNDIISKEKFSQLEKNVNNELFKKGYDKNNYYNQLEELEIRSNCQYFINDNFSVEPNGDIYKCTVLLKNRIGNVNENIDYKKMKVNMDKFKNCTECVFYGMCNQILCNKFDNKLTCKNVEKHISTILENIPEELFVKVANLEGDKELRGFKL